MKELNNKEIEIITKELSAFQNNFEDIKILKENKQYFIFKTDNIEENYSNYIYYNNDIKIIKGWLYGAVQANNKMIKSL